MNTDLPLDQRLRYLAEPVDAALRADMDLAYQVLYQAKLPVFVLLGMSRWSLRLIDLVLAAKAEPRPNDNLFDCINRLHAGDGKKITGLGVLPGEMATLLHALRVYSNKLDHLAEMVTIGHDDAELCLRLFLRVVGWFYKDSGLVPSLATIYRPAPPGPTVGVRPAAPAVIPWRPADQGGIMQALLGIRFFDEMARAFNTPGNADYLLTMAGLPADGLAPMYGQAPVVYWTAVGVALERGLVPDGLARLARAALHAYPGNETFALAAGLFA